ncbi:MULTISPECIES: hypothetical protein [Anoxybacillus]|nr:MULTISPECIES: hypothetical protein [Anoxybacillus]
MTKKVNEGSKNQNAPTQHGKLHEEVGDNSKGRKQNKSQNDKTE